MLPSFKYHPNCIRKSYMRYLICALALVPCLAASPSFAASSPASAPPFTADIGGMRITVEQPWYLYTHGEADNKPERLFFTLMDAANDGNDVRGEGTVYEFPAAADDLLPAQERIRGMGAARLQKFVRELDRKYTRFDSTGPVALTEINGFTSIVREVWKKAATDPELQLTYYFPLRDRLVVLHAYIYGDADEAVVLKNICTSFIPDTSPVQALNTVIGGGVSLSFPRAWSVVMNGFTGKKDTVWAVLEKRAGEEGKRLAKVSVLGPVASAATMFTSNPEQFLSDAEQAKQLVFHALGHRASLENIKVMREETVRTV